MSIAITCPRCQQQYNVDDKLAGKKVKCRGCSSPIAVPAGSEEVLELEGEREMKAPAPPPPTVAAARSASGRQVRVHVTRCPSCTAILSEGAVICTLCGMNLQTGQKEHVENFLDTGAADETPAQKRWFRRRGLPILESADELLKLALSLFTVASIGIWVWHLSETPHGITIVHLIPVALVTALLAGVMAPVAAAAVNGFVRLLKYIPRSDTYWRVALPLMLPFAGSLAAAFPGMGKSLEPLVPMSWVAGVGLLIFFLRAELIEWLVSVATATAAICVMWLVLAGLTSTVGKRAPLYAEMVPGVPWTSFTTSKAPPRGGIAGAIAGGPAITPASPAAMPPAAPATPPPPSSAAPPNTTFPTGPTPSVPSAALVTAAPPTGPSAAAEPTTPARNNTAPGTATPAEAAAPPMREISVASPYLLDIQKDIPELKGIGELVVPSLAAPQFLITRPRPEENVTAVERWSASPLKKQGETIFPLFAPQPATYTLSPKGDVLVALSYFPRTQVDLVYFDRTPRKSIPIEAKDASGEAAVPTLLGFVTPGLFLVRWDVKGQSGIQVWNTAAMPRPEYKAEREYALPPVHPGCAAVISPVGGLLAVAGRDGYIHLVEASTGAVRRRIQPSNLPHRFVDMAFSSDGVQLAVYAVISDTPTVISYRVQTGDTIGGAVLAKGPGSPAPTEAEMTAEGAPPSRRAAHEKRDFVWLQGMPVWLVNGTELIDATTGRKFGTITTSGIAGLKQVGAGQLMFLTEGGKADAVWARLNEAEITAAIQKLR